VYSDKSNGLPGVAIACKLPALDLCASVVSVCIDARRTFLLNLEAAVFLAALESAGAAVCTILVFLGVRLPDSRTAG
jgi:hypothetical protein